MTNENQIRIKTPQFKRGLKSVLEARLVPSDLGVLLAGEPAFETDTGQLKIGNGKDSYKDLPYVGDVSAEYKSKINQNAEDIVDIKSRLETLEDIKHHEHENKSELDKITIGDVEKWNSLKNYDDSDVVARIVSLEGKPFDTYAIKSDVETELAKKLESSDLANYDNKDEVASKISSAVSGILEQLNSRFVSLETADITHESAITTLSGTIAILTGNGDGSIAKQIATGIASIVAEAPEAFDTLKEIADYIAGDKTNAAELLNKVNANADAIVAEVNRASEKEAELSNLIQTNINAIAILNGDESGSINMKIADAIKGIPMATEDVLGLVKVGKTLKIDEEGKLNASEISTDLLVQGEQELVLMGGCAE